MSQSCFVLLITGLFLCGIITFLFGISATVASTPLEVELTATSIVATNAQIQAFMDATATAIAATPAPTG